MQMHVGGLRLEVDLQGPADGTPLLLIQGLGMQLTDWPEGLVRMAVDAGFRVIRYDPRDIGLSTPLDHLGRTPVAGAAVTMTMGAFWGVKPRPAYTLADLADEASGLLKALGLARAVVVGMSMGGIVAQHLARLHPQQVTGLGLMMTTSGSPWLPRMDHRVAQALFAPPPSRHHFEPLVHHHLAVHRLIASPAFPEDPKALHARVAAGLRRSFRPQAVERQVVAVMADGDRSPWLKALAVPCLVVHGQADRMVPAAAGRDLARRIPGARHEEIPGLGHDLPEAPWPRFVAGWRRLAG